MEKATCRGFVAGVAFAAVLYPVVVRAQEFFSALYTPTTPIALVANVAQVIPTQAGMCSVSIWNNNAEPVYFGGSGPAGAGTGTGAVSVASGMPICTATASCKDSWVDLDVSSGGAAIIAANNVAVVRYVYSVCADGM